MASSPWPTALYQGNPSSSFSVPSQPTPPQSAMASLSPPSQLSPMHQHLQQHQQPPQQQPYPPPASMQYPPLPPPPPPPGQQGQYPGPNPNSNNTSTYYRQPQPGQQQPPQQQQYSPYPSPSTSYALPPPPPLPQQQQQQQQQQQPVPPYASPSVPPQQHPSGPYAGHQSQLGPSGPPGPPGPLRGNPLPGYSPGLAVNGPPGGPDNIGSTPGSTMGITSLRSTPGFLYEHNSSASAPVSTMLKPDPNSDKSLTLPPISQKQPQAYHLHSRNSSIASNNPDSHHTQQQSQSFPTTSASPGPVPIKQQFRKTKSSSISVNGGLVVGSSSPSSSMTQQQPPQQSSVLHLSNSSPASTKATTYVASPPGNGGSPLAPLSTDSATTSPNNSTRKPVKRRRRVSSLNQSDYDSPQQGGKKKRHQKKSSSVAKALDGSASPGPALTNMLAPGQQQQQQLPPQLQPPQLQQPNGAPPTPTSVGPKPSGEPVGKPVGTGMFAENSVVQSLDLITLQTWCSLGSFAHTLQLLEKSTSCYESALSKDPQFVPALVGLASLNRDNENFEKAIEFYHAALAIDKSVGTTWEALAHCYLMADNLRDSFSAYQQALNLLPNPNVPKLWYGIAILYERCETYELAKECFQRVLDIDPNYEKKSDIHFRLGIIYKQEQNYAQALECFRMILNMPPPPLSEIDVWFQIGNVHEILEEFSAAQQAYEHFLSQNPTHAKVLQQLGWLHYQQYMKNNKSLQEHQAMSLHPQQQPPPPPQITKESQDALLELAISRLSQSLDIEPADGYTWYLLGRSLMQQEQHSHAYTAYQQAVYKDPQNPRFWCSIGILYYRITQYRDALDAYTRAIQLAPDPSASSAGGANANGSTAPSATAAEPWYNAAILYEVSNNQPNDAISAIENAVQSDPTNAIYTAHLRALHASVASGGNTPIPPELRVPREPPVPVDRPLPFAPAAAAAAPGSTNNGVNTNGTNPGASGGPQSQPPSRDYPRPSPMSASLPAFAPPVTGAR